MDAVVSYPILTLLVITAICYAVFDLIHTGSLKSLCLSNLKKKETIQYLAFFLCLTVIFALSMLPRNDWALSTSAFAVSLLLPFLLAVVGLSSGFIGAFLLLVVYALTTAAHHVISYDSVLTIGLGLALYKCIDLLFLRRKIQFEDIIPAMTWLTTLAWYQSLFFSHAIGDKANLAAQQELVLLTLAVTLGLKPLSVLVAGPDKFYLKRIAIAITGGLALFILTNVLLLKPFFAFVAALYAAGLFVSLLCNSAFFEKPSLGQESTSYHRQLHFVILIGILCLVGSRTFSTMSFLVLAPTALLASASTAGAAVALFWTTRVLLQAFVVNYNSNVTGINLMHPYVSASMFAGFFLSLLFMVNLMRPAKAWQDSLFFIAIASCSPILSSFFLHEEPTSGFLSSLLTASVLLICLAPLLNPTNDQPERLNVLILLPAVSLLAALISSNLLGMGNDTPTSERFHIALYLTAGFAAVTLVAFVTSIIKRPKPASGVSV